jgi:hypothetical protein
MVAIRLALVRVLVLSSYSTPYYSTCTVLVQIGALLPIRQGKTTIQNLGTDRGLPFARFDIG